MPAALTRVELDDFSARLADTATHLLATEGFHAVSMRRVAAEVGVTAMALYRYVSDKEALLALVRTRAYLRLARSQERASRKSTDPIEQIVALGRSLVRFARRNRDAYQLMFLLETISSTDSPEQTQAMAAAWVPVQRAVADAVDAKQLGGDPESLAHVFFASLHGIVSLSILRKLAGAPPLDDLVEVMIETLLDGARP